MIRITRIDTFKDAPSSSWPYVHSVKEFIVDPYMNHYHGSFYVCMYIHMNVSVHVSMYVCMYVHTLAMLLMCMYVASDYVSNYI